MQNFEKFRARKKAERSPSPAKVSDRFYLDELMINWAALPDNWTKLLFWLKRSAPGLKINRVYSNLFCPALEAVAQTVLAALEGDPAIVPAHRQPLAEVGNAARVRALVELLAKPAG